MSMGIVAGAVAVGGTILGNRNQKKAAEMQANSARDANQLQLDMFNKIQDNLNPFVQYGQSMIPQMSEIMAPFDVDKATADYLNSGRYAMSEEALNRSLATQSEAAGVGGSAMSNAMANALPNLINQDISRQYGERADAFNMANAMMTMGQNAAAQVGTAGQNYASQAGANMMNSANNMAAAQIARGNNTVNTMGDLLGIGYSMYNGTF